MKLGNYARISAAKQARTKAVTKPSGSRFEATAGTSANAAAVDLNEHDITTPAGGAWRTERMIRARRRLGLA